MADLPPRITLSRAKGWRLQDVTPGAVIVSRPTMWGNPFTVADARDSGNKGDDRALAEMCVHAFDGWLRGDRQNWMGDNSDKAAQRILSELPTLRGKPLACWCKPGCPCHADVLLRLANG